MPTYAYECRDCGHGFEEFQSITAGALRKCPSCGRLKLQRLIGSGAAIIFKGGGFYQTDYRSKSYKAGEKAEKDGQGKDTKESSSSSKESGSKESGSKDSGSTEKGPADSAKPAATKPDKKNNKDS